MKSKKDLATYLADRNAKTLAWVNAGEGRWATTFVEDLDHWAEYGIHTPLQFEWYMAACDRYQACKDAYGYKPYWGDMPTTEAELKAETVELEPGSELWIYSDAAIELTDVAGDEMGTTGFRDAISLIRNTGQTQSPTQAMRQLLASFSGRDQFIDDLSLMVVYWS